MFTRSVARTAVKAPAAPRAAPAPRPAGARPVKMAANAPSRDDLEKLAGAAADAAKEYASKAKEVLAKADLDSVKGAVSVAQDSIKGTLDGALALWGKFDANGDGRLSIDEAVELLNCKEVSDAINKVTGLEHTKRTRKDIQAWFNRADFDKSGDLSKREFAVMYVGLLADKAKLGAAGMAQAVCAALDKDGDGIISSDEFKALLQSSPLAPVAAVIPAGQKINYREILGGKK